jgi:hypothetical protein
MTITFLRFLNLRVALVAVVDMVDMVVTVDPAADVEGAAEH